MSKLMFLQFCAIVIAEPESAWKQSGQDPAPRLHPREAKLLTFLNSSLPLRRSAARWRRSGTRPLKIKSENGESRSNYVYRLFNPNVIAKSIVYSERLTSPGRFG